MEQIKMAQKNVRIEIAPSLRKLPSYINAVNFHPSEFVIRSVESISNQDYIRISCINNGQEKVNIKQPPVKSNDSKHEKIRVVPLDEELIGRINRTLEKFVKEYPADAASNDISSVDPDVEIVEQKIDVIDLCDADDDVIVL